jgi:glycosyltransferase involved in cell wall biosynthesis
VARRGSSHERAIPRRSGLTRCSFLLADRLGGQPFGWCARKPGRASRVLAIYEPDAHGHRLHYVRRLVDAAHAAGTETVVYTSDAARTSAEAATHLRPDVLEPVCGSVPDSVWGEVAALRRLIKAHSAADTLLIPDGDRRLLATLIARCLTGGRRGGPAMGLLLMRNRPAVRRSVPAYVVKSVIAHGCRGVGIRVARLSAPLATRHAPCFPLLRLLPAVEDPVPDGPSTSREEARQRIGLAATDTVLLMAGYLDARKCPETVLDWLRATTCQPRPILILAGRLDDRTRQLVAEIHREDVADVRVHDGHVSEDFLNLLYAACDAVFCLHLNQGSSGALAHALAHKRPVIAWGSADVIDVVAARGVGVVLPARSLSSLDQAVRGALALSWPDSIAADLAKATSGTAFLAALAPHLAPGVRAEGVIHQI